MPNEFLFCTTRILNFSSRTLVPILRQSNMFDTGCVGPFCFLVVWRGVVYVGVNKTICVQIFRTIQEINIILNESLLWRSSALLPFLRSLNKHTLYHSIRSYCFRMMYIPIRTTFDLEIHICLWKFHFRYIENIEYHFTCHNWLNSCCSIILICVYFFTKSQWHLLEQKCVQRTCPLPGHTNK